MTTAFNEADVVRDSAGKFGEKQQSAPEAVLPEAPGNVWVIEGDDHEVELVEADIVEEAINIAAERFEERYGDDDDEDGGGDSDMADLLVVVGNFRGDIDDTDSLVFVPIEGAEDEDAAYRALDNY